MNICKKISLTLLGLSVFLASPSFASPNPYDLAGECHSISRHLMQLVYSNPKDTCAPDVGVAAAYVQSAAINLEHFHRNEALRVLDKGQWELEALQSKPQCSYFASIVKPEIAKMIILHAEIEMLLRANAESGHKQA